MKKRKLAVIAVCCIFSFCEMQAQFFLNGSFENWAQPGVCEINTSPDNWSNYSTGCIALDEAHTSLCPSTIPGMASQGNVYARACAGPEWQGGEGVFQIVSGLLSGQSYTLSFDYAGSNLYGGSDSVRWNVFFDDVKFYHTPFFSSSKNTWSTQKAVFTATKSSYKIGVRAYFINPSTTSDGSAAIDNISLVGLSTGIRELSDGQLRVFLSNLKNVLEVETTVQGQFEITLYDIGLKELLRAQFSEPTSFQVGHLAPGLYLAVVTQDGHILKRSKVIKE